MWLSRCLKLIDDHKGLVVIDAPAVYGASEIIASFSGEAMPLVWVEFSEKDALDAHSQAFVIVQAVKKALGDVILPIGMPANYTLKALARQLEFFGPVVIAASNLHFVPELLADLLDLHAAGSWVILAFDSQVKPFEVPAKAKLLNAKALKLRVDEALQLGPSLSEELIKTVLKESKAALCNFQSALNKHLQIPPPLYAGPNGPRFAASDEPEVDPAIVIKALLRTKRYQQALELACLLSPEVVSDFIAEAGHYFHERGLHKQLYTFLQALPRKYQQSDEVLFWLFTAAYVLGKAEDYFHEVSAYLEEHEAPKLRAAFASLFPQLKDRFEQVERAYKAEANAYTSFQYARLQPDPDTAIEVILDSINIAEATGKHYEVARAAGLYAMKLRDKGLYRDGLSWASYAISEYDKAGYTDYVRRLRILYEWAYLRFLTGESAGLEILLFDNEVLLENVDHYLARRYRSTLADSLLLAGDVQEALRYHRKNLTDVPRQLLSNYTLHLVRALLEIGEQEEAERRALLAVSLSSNYCFIEPHLASLSLGMALSETKPKEATLHLKEAAQGFLRFPHAHYQAQIALYLARAYLNLGDKRLARKTIQQSLAFLEQLAPAGLALLAGPKPLFRQVYNMVRPTTQGLDLNFLGDQKVWLNNSLINLNLTQCEILTVLAIKGRPVSLEELADVFAHRKNPHDSLKADLSRLRNKIPISRAPYSISFELETDFQKTFEALSKGQLLEALSYYDGPLLAQSKLSFIREYDDLVLESLRQSLLQSQQLEAIMKFLERHPDDLEILEHASSLLPKKDPRYQLLKVRELSVKKDWGVQ